MDALAEYEIDFATMFGPGSGVTMEEHALRTLTAYHSRVLRSAAISADERYEYMCMLCTLFDRVWKIHISDDGLHSERKVCTVGPKELWFIAGKYKCNAWPFEIVIRINQYCRDFFRFQMRQFLRDEPHVLREVALGRPPVVSTMASRESKAAVPASSSSNDLPPPPERVYTGLSAVWYDVPDGLEARTKILQQLRRTLGLLHHGREVIKRWSELKAAPSNPAVDFMADECRLLTGYYHVVRGAIGYMEACRDIARPRPTVNAVRWAGIAVRGLSPARLPDWSQGLAKRAEVACVYAAGVLNQQENRVDEAYQCFEAVRSALLTVFDGDAASVFLRDKIETTKRTAGLLHIALTQPPLPSLATLLAKTLEAHDPDKCTDFKTGTLCIRAEFPSALTPKSSPLSL